MMNKFCYTFLLCLKFSVSSNAQLKSYAYFVPKNYDTLAVVYGDLNKDGTKDCVLALRHKSESKEMQEVDVDSMPPRILIVLIGSPTGFTLGATSYKALLCKYCGGIFGDPFAQIKIANNVLEVSHYGGSAWRWAYTHKFRYQNKDWFLIGKTSLSYWNVKHCDKLNDFAGTDNEDINYVTGDYQIKKISENCKLLTNKKGKKKIQPLIPLNKFSIEQ